jgi:hypothetical protein
MSDAEMDVLLEEREKHIESLPYVFIDEAEEWGSRDYVLRLDAALPWMVGEIRRLRVTLAEATVRLERLQVELLEYGD